jgi:hypothetical protein
MVMSFYQASGINEFKVLGHKIKDQWVDWIPDDAVREIFKGIFGQIKVMDLGGFTLEPRLFDWKDPVQQTPQVFVSKDDKILSRDEFKELKNKHFVWH